MVDGRGLTRIKQKQLSTQALEQIRMRAGADEVQILLFDLVDQEPIRFDVAIAEVLPFAAERMIPIP